MRLSKIIVLFSISSFLFIQCNSNQSIMNTPKKTLGKYSIAIHGGAGTISRAKMTAEKEKAYLIALDTALSIGENILKNGGTSLDAVEKTIMYLEDCPLFNAGKGAVFAHNGKNELDASIMDGATQKAGAIGGVTVIKNPIRAARAVMEKSEHVFLVGRGAEIFAKSKGIDTVPNSYFFTEDRWQSLQRALEAERKMGVIENQAIKNDYKFGTVGVVCLDKNGNLAAGTSTGGMTNKRWNRLGDSPIIGAGTYADNASAAVSATGHGEFFIRYTVARNICALMEYKNWSLQKAADEIVLKKLVEKGGEGGIIAVDYEGNVAMPFNSEGMYRAFAKSTGERKILIFK